MLRAKYVSRRHADGRRFTYRARGTRAPCVVTATHRTVRVHLRESAAAVQQRDISIGGRAMGRRQHKMAGAAFLERETCAAQCARCQRRCTDLCCDCRRAHDMPPFDAVALELAAVSAPTYPSPLAHRSPESGSCIRIDPVIDSAGAGATSVLCGGGGFPAPSQLCCLRA